MIPNNNCVVIPKKPNNVEDYKINEKIFANNYCDYIKLKIKYTKNQQNSSLVFIDPSMRQVLILLLPTLFIIYNLLIFTSLSMDRLHDTTYYVREQLSYSYDWLSDRSDNLSIITPFLFGLGFTLFSWMIIYLDSNTPGLNPPSPFSPNSKFQYRKQKKSAMHLSYLTAIFGGIVITGLMLFN